MLSYVIAASAALDSLAQTASADGQIGAAKIAIVGVLFTAILGAWGVYHRARLDRQLATLKSDHEVRLLKLEDVQARAP